MSAQAAEIFQDANWTDMTCDRCKNKKKKERNLMTALSDMESESGMYKVEKVKHL